MKENAEITNSLSEKLRNALESNDLIPETIEDWNRLSDAFNRLFMRYLEDILNERKHN